jgi:hypothetical protein
MQNGRRRTRLLFYSAFCILTSALLIFCHGCHAGDHDDELQVLLLDRDR